jgi:hypothetical protein
MRRTYVCMAGLATAHNYCIRHYNYFNYTVMKLLQCLVTIPIISNVRFCSPPEPYRLLTPLCHRYGTMVLTTLPWELVAIMFKISIWTACTSIEPYVHQLRNSQRILQIYQRWPVRQKNMQCTLWESVTATLIISLCMKWNPHHVMA